jgi:hypothetical protein
LDSPVSEALPASADVAPLPSGSVTAPPPLGLACGAFPKGFDPLASEWGSRARLSNLSCCCCYFDKFLPQGGREKNWAGVFLDRSHLTVRDPTQSFVVGDKT